MVLSQNIKTETTLTNILLAPRPVISTSFLTKSYGVTPASPAMQEDIYRQACHLLLHHPTAIENANNDLFSTDKETQIHKVYGRWQVLKTSAKIFCAVLLRTAVPVSLKPRS